MRSPSSSSRRFSCARALWMRASRSARCSVRSSAFSLSLVTSPSLPTSRCGARRASPPPASCSAAREVRRRRPARCSRRVRPRRRTRPTKAVDVAGSRRCGVPRRRLRRRPTSPAVMRSARAADPRRTRPSRPAGRPSRPVRRAPPRPPSRRRAWPGPPSCRTRQHRRARRGASAAPTASGRGTAWIERRARSGHGGCGPPPSRTRAPRRRLTRDARRFASGLRAAPADAPPRSAPAPGARATETKAMVDLGLTAGVSPRRSRGSSKRRHRRRRCTTRDGELPVAHDGDAAFSSRVAHAAARCSTCASRRSRPCTTR